MAHALASTEVGAWSEVPVEGSLPLRRSCTLTLSGGRAFVIGGRLADATVTNDVHCLTCDQDRYAWDLVDVDGDTGPSPRECHTACALPDGRIVVLAGQVSRVEALDLHNDIYLYDPANNAWTKVDVDESRGPPPVARHAAVYYPARNSIITFGGYRKTTRRLNDVYELSLDTLTWSMPVVSGESPSPRYGHSMVVCDDQLFVMGGVDSSNNAMNDFHVLNLRKMAWVPAPASAKLPRAIAMFSAVSVPSAGSHKVFIFGGQTSSIMNFTNKVSYLDLHTMEWKDVRVTDGHPPPVCADSAMVYDPITMRLVIVGGAGNEHLDRPYFLDVSQIVGPSYSISGLSPARGPLHGGMFCEISGVDYYESDQITVLLTDGKRDVVVQGIYKNESTIQFTTPDLSVLGDRPMSVNVRLSLESSAGYTVNDVTFELYLDTSAPLSLAYGPGLRKLQPTNALTTFIVFAKNLSGQDRTHGGDAFECAITALRSEEDIAAEESAALVKQQQQQQQQLGGDKDKEKEKGGGKGSGGRGGSVSSPRGGSAQSKSGAKGGSKLARGGGDADDLDDGDDIDGDGAGGAGGGAGDGDDGGDRKVYEEVVPVVRDTDDGRYHVSFTVRTEGTYMVDVSLGGQQVRGSPFKIEARDHFRDPYAGEYVGEGAKRSNFLPVMKHEVPARLAALESQVQQYQSTLAMQVTSGKVHTLIKVMSCIEEIHSVQEDIELELACLYETTAYLRASHDPNADAHRKRHKHVNNLFGKVREAIPETEKELLHHKNIAKVDVKSKIEAFVAHVDAFAADAPTKPYYEYSFPINDVFHELDVVRADMVRHETYAEELSHLAGLFSFTSLLAPALEKLRGVGAELQQVKALWDQIDLIRAQLADYQTVKWPDLKPELMEMRTRELAKELKTLDRSVRGCDAYVQIAAFVKNFQQSCPLVVNLRHESMRERHWEQLMNATGVHFVIDEAFSLSDLIALDLPRFEAEVDAIVDRALKEEKMERSLARLESLWSEVEFQRTKHLDTDIELVKVSEEDYEQLENDQLVVQSMMGSKYMMTFEQRVLHWKRSLTGIERVVTVWVEIQRTWAYLVNLFIGSEEVKRDLPEDSQRFIGIDKEVTEFLRLAARQPNVLETCNEEGRYEQFQDVQARLELCEKSLFEYLDSKRMAFPRFFFVSTTDLLDILCNGNSPRKIMMHMSKIFQAIKRLELDESNPPTAKAIVSAIGVETVDLATPLRLTGKVESYLTDVITEMQATVKAVLKRSVAEYPKQSREGWLMGFPSQVVLVTTQIVWTTEICKALDAAGAGDRDALRKYRDVQKAQIDRLIDLVCGDLAKPVRQKVMVLITLDTHARDVTDTLINEGVDSTSHFRWQSQLRYSWREDEDTCAININDASFRYGYEYLGNGARLVITPLTDRIYITATQSLHLRLGCAPAGPAGTGKTETTKDLASQLGKPCYVFNCSDQMDYKGMGNIFKGLAASGSWGCFDEFNRLVPEVLSVCSQQFSAVLTAIREGATEFTVEGATLKLDPTCGVFITMNPGYLGRTELPETLKTLFRPITVVVPDLAQICENMLMAEGFKEARVLARKFTTLYALLKDLLSKQDHYDWGLRAIKAVLVVAGSFKRAEPEIAEADLLMRALRDSNLAKIPDDDVPVFMGLIGDLFPGASIPRKRDLDLEKAIKEVCGDVAVWPELGGGRCLTPEESFMLKVVQLDELLAIRHSVFIIGTSGTSKSATWATLAKAWTRTGRPTTVRDLNPKAITSNELYGYVELSTREWKDGLLSNMMRELAAVPDEDPKWIILDGDLDTNWIESMNSVMDDNRILTLASNERIPLLPHMRLIFEIRDLKYASPATVSRAGIIFMSEGVQWHSYVCAWVAARQAEGKSAPDTCQLLLELFEKYVPETLRYISKNIKHVVPILGFNMVQSICYLLEGMLDPEDPEDKPSSPAAIETFFVFAAVWGFGSAISKKDNVDYRVHFSDWWKDTYKGVKFPGRASVFDVFVDPATARFVQWRSIVEEIEYDSMVDPMSTVNVPIAETTSVTYFMRGLMARRRPVMLVGNAGCGKTALVKGLLSSMVDETLMYQTISLNYYTDSAGIQKSLEDPLEKKAGRNFGPPGNRRLVYFVDDLNMPMLDVYNTQTPIALLRQHLDYGHWFDREKLSHQSLKRIDQCQYICAMNPTAGSFTVNPRLQRHFVSFALDLPSPGSLMDIYRTFLGGHLQHFIPDVQDMLTKVVHAALLLHSRVTETFRKTAVNFHYEFNMRHMANVFQGLLMAKPKPFSDPEQGPRKFAELWLHESERVYCDRLVSAADVKSYQRVAREVTSKHFAAYNLNHLFEEKSNASLVFSHFAAGLGEKSYDRAASKASIKAVLEEALGEYNEENARMELLLFDDAARHVCRIARIIESPSGHALLVGVGGSGKQSLSRLAAFTCGYSVFQITISSTYSMTDLKEDLKSLYLRTGQKDEGVLFLLTEAQITNERFLVYINDLLASGDVPDLFAADERDNIVNSVRLMVKAAGIEDTRDNCWEFFLNKVRANLHVALCFSPIGEAFRVRLRRFPALVNCTVIDWFHPWPRDALLGVAKRFLAEVDLGTDEAVRRGVEEFMPFSYGMVNEVSGQYLAKERRHYHTTPKSYLELISLFKSMLQAKRDDLKGTIARLGSGLAKLEVTSKDVDKLQEELRVRSVEVEEKKLAAEVFADQVGKEKAIVEEESAKAAIEAENCEKIQADVSVRRERCETELAAAEPLIERAEAALNTLNKKELTELKSMLRPPAGVDDVMLAVMVLLAPKNGMPKAAQRTWPNAVNLMGKVDGFLATLRNFKTEIDNLRVPDKNFQEARAYLAKEHFNQAAISVKSKAAGGICEWVINIVEYYDIFCKVEPMRVALADAESQLSTANTKLQDIRATVLELESKLATLMEEYDAAEAEKQKMIDEVNHYQRKLDLAHRLISALESESVRWNAGVKDLGAALDVVIGDVLLSSAFVSYIGGFSKRFRDELVQGWVAFMRENGVPMSESTDVLRILTTDSRVAQWQNQGLPADRVSTENATIVSSAERWPLIIDPQLQGITWLKENVLARSKAEGGGGGGDGDGDGDAADDSLIVLRLGQKGLTHRMEMAIEQGRTVLIENIGESIDAVLGPVVARQTIRKLGVNYMKLGDKEVEHNPDFQLYLHTKLSNPHYPPEIQAETTLVNFAVTEAGLEDQMLAIVVRRERPDLEARKGALIKQQNEFKIKLKELEDDLLQRLATAEGDLTENLPLIENLEESKRLAAEIQEKVRIARQTEVKINAAREAYRPVANRAALMFFLLSELRKVNAFYEYSLSAFVDVFERGIANTPGARKPKVKRARRGSSSSAGGGGGDNDNNDADGGGAAPSESSSSSEDDEDRPLEEGELPLDERIAALIEHTTYAVFQYTRRSLFDRHRLIFASQVCLAIEERAGKLDPKELNFLVKGEKVFGTRPDRERLQRFLPEPVWAALTALVECENFSKFQVEISKNADAWEKWTGEEMPELVDLPKDAKGPVRTAFQKLCVIRAMRPDRMTSALRDWVRSTLGDKYVDEEPFVLRDIYEETSKTTPMMFILFPGAQPVKDVEALAREKGARLVTISMGQGQEPAAEAALDDLSTNGGWIFLDNVHLMSTWLPVLERKLELIAESGHEDFRFFFSAEPGGNALVSAVPESILQASIKLVNEPPSDLKANLRRAFAQFSQATFDRSTKQDQFKPCLFALCFFHSLVLGRRKFGAIGWSRHYSFNMGDLTICADVLMNYLDRSPTVPWDDLRYMFGEIMYGGHITDHWDRRTNNTYLEVILRPELFSGVELAPSFRVPDAAGDYELYKAHIEQNLPAKENPVMFGLHSNAEINFLTEEGTVLFSTIQDLQGAGGEGGVDHDKVVLQAIDRMLEELPHEFDMLELVERIEERSPFMVILLQETTRANGLIWEIRRSLVEAKLGLTGQLNVSEAMEQCTNNVFLGRIPPTWVPVSYPSTKPLAAWMVDLRARVEQLEVWCEQLEKPSPVALPYLFNPQAFLTAVQQVTSRRQGYPLDFVGIQTDVTPYYTAEELAQIPAPEDDADVDDGVYINGLYLQGCSWDTEERILTDSKLKELFVPLPVIKVTAKLREDIVHKERYICPVYSTTMRGPTYVFEAQLPSDREQSEWVIAGAAIIMSLPG